MKMSFCYPFCSLEVECQERKDIIQDDYQITVLLISPLNDKNPQNDRAKWYFHENMRGKPFVKYFKKTEIFDKNPEEPDKNITILHRKNRAWEKSLQDLDLSAFNGSGVEFACKDTKSLKKLIQEFKKMIKRINTEISEAVFFGFEELPNVWCAKERIYTGINDKDDDKVSE